MIEVMIDSIRVSLTSQQRIVLLRRLDEDKYLPIWIGPFEAEAITISLQEIEMARPQTHDLILQILGQMNARLVRVEVVSLKEDVFYGNLVIEKEGQTYQIDARPSDSIALAVRGHVPIWVASDIFDTAGIVVEPDMQVEAAEEETTVETPAQEEDQKKRLSVFEDFLQNLDSGDQDDRPGEDPQVPDPPESPDEPK
jgi:bifunctional DNase/RNase